MGTPGLGDAQVLDVAVHIWNRGGDFAEIPSRKDHELPTPPVRPEAALGQAGDEASPSAGAPALAEAGGVAIALPAPSAAARNTYPAEMRAYMQERRRVEKLNRELHALRCDANYKLEIAKAVRTAIRALGTGARRALTRAAPTPARLLSLFPPPSAVFR